MGSGATLGDVIAERYLLERELGRGGMATVFLAVDQRLNRNVAVKILHTDLARQPSFRTRFRQEAQAVARLTHPNVVRVFDAGESSDPTDSTVAWPFLVMEYIDGELLADRISRGPLPFDQAVSIESELLDALEYAHATGFVHRDVKPENIMLSTAGGAKVMDFGIARSLDEVADTVAQTTSILGTAAYFSPEQARGEGVDVRSDVYSAGIVLFEMLTGRVPFTGDSPVRVAYQHLSEPVPKAADLSPTVTPAIDAVLARALTKNKLERYQSAQDFSNALRAAVNGEDYSAFAPDTSALFVNQFNVTDLNSDELALRQLAEDTSEVRPTNRPPVMWFWAGGTLIFALVVAVMFWAITFAPSGALPSSDREIPALEGLSESDATAALTKLDLVPVAVQISDETVPLGKTVRSDPESGNIVTEGTRVTVYVSKGKSAVAVPELANMSIEQAKAALISAGFKPGAEVPIGSPNAPAGTVVGSDPAAGSPSVAGTVINVNVSTGLVTIPDVVNTPLAEASALLSGSDFRLRVEPVPDRSCKLKPNNPVYAQSAGPGSAQQGSSVKLNFCAG